MSDMTLWEDKQLPTPRVPTSLVDSLEVFDYVHYGSLIAPAPKSDYMLTPSLEYLTGNIPDQYVLSHWGHGINSYSMNFRCAYGDMAMIAQLGYGGAYQDPQRQNDKWAELVSAIDQSFDLAFRKPAGPPRGRSIIVAFSDFRELPTYSDEGKAFTTGAAIYQNSPNGLVHYRTCSSLPELLDDIESLLGGYNPS